MNKIAENIIRAVKKTEKGCLTQDEVFELVLNATKENEIKIIENGEIKLNRSNMTVSVNGVESRLHKLMFNLLLYLMQHEGETIAREILMRDIWGNNVFVTTRTIDVCICKIRNIIGKEKIQTIKKVGYSFVN
jgi:two-component system alkaline phosphatase synthesis response regulator PhoP